MRQALVIIFLLFSSKVFAPIDSQIVICKSEPANPFLDLWKATCIVESGNKPDTINKHEQAFGIAQIRSIRIRDYNQRTRSHYTLYDCLDSAVAYKIYMHYASRYGPTDLESIARAWNGSGEQTKKYWKLIKANL